MDEQTQQLLTQAQLYQQQMQGLTMQKETLNMQSSEIATALDEVEKSKAGDVYKISGPVLIKAEKTDLAKDLKEKKELIELKIQTIAKSEDKIKAKIEELRDQLTKAGLGS